MEKKISLRVSDEDLEVIDSFIARHDFNNRSEFLREAALDYIERYSEPKGQEEVPERIKLPKRLKNNIWYLIKMGHYNDWQDAIHELVREGLLKEDMEKLERQYDAVDSLSSKVETFKSFAEEENEYMKK
ncbi:MAG: ribbon-helix-helix domain-containing protein [Candidatus Aenigmatarchaeota archaeon]